MNNSMFFRTSHMVHKFVENNQIYVLFFFQPQFLLYRDSSGLQGRVVFTVNSATVFCEELISCRHSLQYTLLRFLRRRESDAVRLARLVEKG